MSGEFIGLHIEDPAALGRLTRAIEAAVAGSFKTSPAAPTMNEIRRRGKICVDLVRELRGDLKWSLPRICDALPRGLRAKLDGTPWDPQNERNIWVPPRDLVV